MFLRQPHSLAPLFAYHGCDKALAEAVYTTAYAVRAELKDAYQNLQMNLQQAGEISPKNHLLQAGTPLLRRLDCAVIRTLHKLRERAELPAYDTVYGVFEEGNLLYPEAGFREKTHVQIAIRNPDCLMGYFHPRTEQKVLL